MIYDPGLQREARALHDELFVVNGMDGSEVDGQLLQELEAGGVDVNLTGGLRGGERPVSSVGSPHLHFVEEHPEGVVHARTISDLERGRREGVPSLVFNWQRVDYLGQEVSRLIGFHRMGLRSCGLVYNVGNYAGSGSVDPHQGPLSRFGHTVVEALDQLGIVLDIGGHASEATSLDAIDAYDGPVVCTHSNPRSLRDNPRAISDRLFRAIADTGGVVGICAFNFFLVPEGRASVEDFLDHVDYAVDLVGADHVGLGLDFILGREISGQADPRRFPPEAYPQRYEDWMIYPEGLSDFSDVPNVTAGLMERGYDRRAIEKIMGENWLRVWRTVWGQ